MWKGFVAFWSQIFFPNVLSPLIKIVAVIKSGSLFQAQISHIHTNEETIYDFTLLGDVQGCWFTKPLLLVMPLYEAATQWKDADKNREEPSTQKQNSVEVEHQFRTSPPLPLEKFSEFCNLHITHFSLHISDHIWWNKFDQVSPLFGPQMVFFSAVDEGTHYYLPWQVQVMITKIYHQLNFGSFIILVRLILITGFEWPYFRFQKNPTSNPKENPISNPRKPCFN
jgi:hypothetical protein